MRTHHTICLELNLVTALTLTVETSSKMIDKYLFTENYALFKIHLCRASVILLSELLLFYLINFLTKLFQESNNAMVLFWGKWVTFWITFTSFSHPEPDVTMCLTCEYGRLVLNKDCFYSCISGVRTAPGPVSGRRAAAGERVWEPGCVSEVRSLSSAPARAQPSGSSPPCSPQSQPGWCTVCPEGRLTLCVCEMLTNSEALL